MVIEWKEGAGCVDEVISAVAVEFGWLGGGYVCNSTYVPPGRGVYAYESTHVPEN